jgi:outer membrane protein insertion porin family
MLFIDGASLALGHSVLQDQSFLFDNKLSLEYALVDNVLALDSFVSATTVSANLSNLTNFSNWDWYFAGGAGLKIKIPGFPIGLYLVKNATLINSESEKFTFLEGGIFNFKDDSIFNGLKLVLSFSTNLF